MHLSIVVSLRFEEELGVSYKLPEAVPTFCESPGNFPYRFAGCQTILAVAESRTARYFNNFNNNLQFQNDLTIQATSHLPPCRHFPASACDKEASNDYEVRKQ